MFNSAVLKQAPRAVLRAVGVVLYYLGLARWVINRSNRPRTVLYHAVEKISGSYTRGLDVNVPPDKFAMHLTYYKRFYNVISMSNYLQSEAAGTKDSRTSLKPPLLITFDDGYSSVFDQALPLLEEHGMPATTYLIGNAVRGRMVWVNRLNQALNDYPAETREILLAYPSLANLNRRGIIYRIQTTFRVPQIQSLIEQLETTIPELSAEPEPLFCTPEQIRQMQERGMEFGFHSNDHWNLGQCKDSELSETLETQGLEGLINSNTFAYPFGYFSASCIGRLKRLGYNKLMAVGNNNDRFSDLHMDRTEVFESSHSALFARLEVEEAVVWAFRRWRNQQSGATVSSTSDDQILSEPRPLRLIDQQPILTRQIDETDQKRAA